MLEALRGQSGRVGVAAMKTYKFQVELPDEPLTFSMAEIGGCPTPARWTPDEARELAVRSLKRYLERWVDEHIKDLTE